VYSEVGQDEGTDNAIRCLEVMIAAAPGSFYERVLKTLLAIRVSGLLSSNHSYPCPGIPGKDFELCWGFGDANNRTYMSVYFNKDNSVEVQYRVLRRLMRVSRKDSPFYKIDSNNYIPEILKRVKNYQNHLFNPKWLGGDLGLRTTR
jgi:hypothetical protein